MKKVGEISEDVRNHLLSIINEQPWRKVQDGGLFYAQKARQIGPYFGRVVNIPPNGNLHPHTDDGPLKRHVVIQTNENAFCYSNDIKYHLDLGGIYEVDASLIHWAENKGETDRIHIIYDCCSP